MIDSSAAQKVKFPLPEACASGTAWCMTIECAAMTDSFTLMPEPPISFSFAVDVENLAKASKRANPVKTWLSRTR